MAIITVIGAGMMGSALSVPASDNGHKVRLVGTPLDTAIIERVQQDHFHPTLKRYLPDTVEAYPFEQAAEMLTGADMVIGGVSSFGLDWFCDTALPLIPAEMPVLSVTKGMIDLSDGTLQPYPEYLAQREYPAVHDLNAIGGPCTSYELADRQHSTVAFCGKSMQTLTLLQSLMQTDYYHITLSTDVVGVECAVALKNAYALGVSLAVGLFEAHGLEGRINPNGPAFAGTGRNLNGDNGGLAYNPQAALFGQSVREMGRLLALAGGGADTLAWGAGDLYVTIFGGRTRRLGTLLGHGLTIHQALEQLQGVTLESVVIAKRTASALRRLTANGKADPADFPLLTHIDRLLCQGETVNVPWQLFR